MPVTLSMKISKALATCSNISFRPLVKSPKKFVFLAKLSKASAYLPILARMSSSANPIRPRISPIGDRALKKLTNACLPISTVLNRPENIFQRSASTGFSVPFAFLPQSPNMASSASKTSPPLPISLKKAATPSDMTFIPALNFLNIGSKASLNLSATGTNELNMSRILFKYWVAGLAPILDRAALKSSKAPVYISVDLVACAPKAFSMALEKSLKEIFPLDTIS